MATNTIAVYYMHILLLFETIKGISGFSSKTLSRKCLRIGLYPIKWPLKLADLMGYILDNDNGLIY